MEEFIGRLAARSTPARKSIGSARSSPNREVLDLAAAEERYAALRQRFGDKVGLVHGRLSGKEKDRVMAAFAAGELSILVSTTVIEVGVDVPNASIMVIEHAERFGLAQLHQLSGRVGRGAAQSSCILLYRKPLARTARDAAQRDASTEDGFVIAEEDLRLRGGGEVLGTRQSGLPEFRIAQLPEDEALLQAARDEARLVLTRDPDLKVRAPRRCSCCFISSSATTRSG